MVAQVIGVRTCVGENEELSKKMVTHQGLAPPYSSSTVHDMISCANSAFSSQSCDFVQAASKTGGNVLSAFPRENVHQDLSASFNRFHTQTHTTYYATATVLPASVMMEAAPPISCQISPTSNNSASTLENLKATTKEQDYFRHLCQQQLPTSRTSPHVNVSGYSGATSAETGYCGNQFQDATSYYSSSSVSLNQSPAERVYEHPTCQIQSPLDSTFEINSFTTQKPATISEISAISTRTFPSVSDRMPATSSLLRQRNNGVNHMRKEQELPCGEPTVVSELSANDHFARNTKRFPPFSSPFADCRFANLTNQRSVYRSQSVDYKTKTSKVKQENNRTYETKSMRNFSDEKLTKMSVRDLNRCLRGCR